MQFIDLGRQRDRLRSGIDRRIKRVLDHGRFIHGPEVKELEAQLAQFVGVDHAIGVANGTDALVLALMALDIGPGDAVFVPTFTFFATAEAVKLVGATPVFVDINEDDYNISVASLAEQVERTRDAGDLNPAAVIPVDLFGCPADYSAIVRVAADTGLWVIEDGAQGFGASIGGDMACSFGDVATTSFFPAKPLGCYGDGGAVFTRDADRADLLRSLRVHGQGTDKYDNVRIGMNSRLDTLQAAVLLEKLTVLAEEIDARDACARRYAEALDEHFVVPVVPQGRRSAWAQYTIRPGTGKREEYLAAMKEHGVPFAVYYPKPLHLQAAFAGLGCAKGAFPVAERLAEEVISIPMHPYLEAQEQETVSEALHAPLRARQSA
jgi:dTDP-4-amino-4,6-dideoxygalactose transaminase